MKLVKSILAASMLATFSTAALADGQCLGGVNSVCFVEEEVQLFGDPSVEYTVTNHLESTIYGFGVTNNSEYNEYDWAYPRTSAGAQGWSSDYISQADWDYGRTFYLYPPKQQFDNLQVLDSDPIRQPKFDGRPWRWVSGEAPTPKEGQQIKPPAPGTVYLGSFASLFGNEDAYVSFFWNEYLGLNTLSYGETSDNNFLQFAFPESQASAFGAGGTVLATTVAAVPEPETYAMFLAGLGLMGFVARRKQA